MTMSIMTIIMGAIGSTILLATHALPDDESALSRIVEAGATLDAILGEVCYAVVFTERSAHAVEFSVPDRDGDDARETIRYAWSGEPGDPLTRQYNGGTVASIVENVHVFDVDYVVQTAPETITTEVTADSGEVLLASFDGWAGISATSKDQPINSSYWTSQYFEVVAPGEAEELEITRAKIQLSHYGTPPGGITVGIYRPLAPGEDYLPDTTPIGTPVTLPGTAVHYPGVVWTEFSFSDVLVSDVTSTGLVMVVKGIDTIPAVTRYLYDRKAPNNGMVMRWSNDGGASWSPSAASFDDNDLMFYVYGTYTSTSTQEVELSRYFVTAATATVQIGADALACVEASIQVLNTPEVAGP